MGEDLQSGHGLDPSQTCSVSLLGHGLPQDSVIVPGKNWLAEFGSQWSRNRWPCVCAASVFRRQHLSLSLQRKLLFKRLL